MLFDGKKNRGEMLFVMDRQKASRKFLVESKGSSGTRFYLSQISGS